MLGRLLSRVRIQTQVMVFIVPFILSIMAVGATGLYASSLLQGRMDISNSVLQSLSGFRNLSAAMAEFLANATQENRDLVTAKLADQRSLLRSSLDRLAADRSGQQELEQTLSSIDGISARMDALWQLQETRFRIEAGFDVFEIGAFITVAKLVVPQKAFRDPLAIKTRQELAQAEGGCSPVVMGHSSRAST